MRADPRRTAMNDIVTDRSMMTALGRQLTAAVAKQAVAASNLANLDTPGYKTREVSFEDALNSQLKGGPALAVTQPGHFSNQPDPQSQQVRESDDLPARRDGNN